MRRLTIAVGLLAGLSATTHVAVAQAGPAVAAASDLSVALPEIAKLFTSKTGATVRLTFGSSGTLTQQVLNGAPFEVFLSADESYVGQIARAGKASDNGFVYAIGRIGVFARKGSHFTADSLLTGLRAALDDNRLGKFAIANPDHAPYGRAAQEALLHAGVWGDINSHLVFGENVSQAVQFATSGAADGGIIPESLARTTAVRNAGTFALIPPSWYRPLRQRAVLMKGASPAARIFFDFLQSPEARAVFRRYGFALPASD